MSETQKNLLVIGSGLAGGLAALSLAKNLGQGRRVSYLRLKQAPFADPLYGGVTAPTAYDFLLGLGLDEPTLFMRTQTSFSLGTKYADWGDLPAWIQCHQQPLPLIRGVPMRHHLTRLQSPLNSILVGAQIAEHGRFAHPPEDPNIPLSRAEYGYQFCVAEWAELVDQFLAQQSVEVVDAGSIEIERDAGGIKRVIVDSDTSLSAQLYVDCTGVDRLCVSALSKTYMPQKRVSFSHAKIAKEQLGPACRQIVTSQEGWSATVSLQGRDETLTISGEPGLSSANSERIVELGRLKEAWVGNCIAIGHANGVAEPLTPAPMMLLQLDIERLLELIPVSENMSAERREYNRRFANDFDHAGLFQSAFFHADNLPPSAYWTSSKDCASDERLVRKLRHYENRGVLVRYDLEPFNDEDWTILHAGLGRAPRQYDLQADGVSRQDAGAQIQALQRSIGAMVSKVPPHHLYVANMKRYFEKQNYA